MISAIAVPSFMAVSPQEPADADARPLFGHDLSRKTPGVCRERQPLRRLGGPRARIMPQGRRGTGIGLMVKRAGTAAAEALICILGSRRGWTGPNFPAADLPFVQP